MHRGEFLTYVHIPSQRPIYVSENMKIWVKENNLLMRT